MSKTLLASLGIFNSYLKESEPQQTSIKKLFAGYNKNTANRDFNLITVASDSEIERLIKQLFLSLGFIEANWHWYFDPNLTVYEFLMELAEKRQSEKLNDILKNIKEKSSFNKKQLLLFALILLAISLIVLLVPPIQAIFSTAIDLTIIGFLYTMSVSIYKFQQNYYEPSINYYEPNKSNFAKRRDTFFLVSNSLLNISGYVLWILNAALMTPLIAGLFIAASASEVLKEMFLGIENHIRYIKAKNGMFPQNNSNEHNIKLLRLESEYKKHHAAALINSSVALILSALIATWCLLPGSIFVSVGIIIAILIVQAAKNFLINSNQKYQRLQLNEGLKIIPQHPPENERLSKTNGLHLHSSTSIKTHCNHQRGFGRIDPAVSPGLRLEPS